MAKFIVNSTGEKAVRLEKVTALIIKPVWTPNPPGGPIPSGYELRLRIADLADQYVEFETGPTIGAVQALAVPILAALEA